MKNKNKKTREKKMLEQKFAGLLPSCVTIQCQLTWWFWKAVEWLSNYIAIHQSELQECAGVGSVLQYGVGWKVVLQ